VRAVGLANAEAYQKQVDALGQAPTALVNAIGSLSRSTVPFVPNILVASGNGGAFEGLAGTLMGLFSKSSALPTPSATNDKEDTRHTGSSA